MWGGGEPPSQTWSMRTPPSWRARRGASSIRATRATWLRTACPRRSSARSESERERSTPRHRCLRFQAADRGAPACDGRAATRRGDCERAGPRGPRTWVSVTTRRTRDRARRERLCLYVCRPPIAQERLEETANGKLRYSVKKACPRRPRPSGCSASRLARRSAAQLPGSLGGGTLRARASSALRAAGGGEPPRVHGGRRLLRSRGRGRESPGPHGDANARRGREAALLRGRHPVLARRATRRRGALGRGGCGRRGSAGATGAPPPAPERRVGALRLARSPGARPRLRPADGGASAPRREALACARDHARGGEVDVEGAKDGVRLRRMAPGELIPMGATCAPTVGTLVPMRAACLFCHAQVVERLMGPMAHGDVVFELEPDPEAASRRVAEERGRRCRCASFARPGPRLEECRSFWRLRKPASSSSTRSRRRPPTR